jgi:hypothetical protein
MFCECVRSLTVAALHGCVVRGVATARVRDGMVRDGMVRDGMVRDGMGPEERIGEAFRACYWRWMSSNINAIIMSP